MELRFQFASLLFFRFDFLELLLVPQFEEMASERFNSNQKVIAEMNAYFAQLNQFYYSEGINKLEQHWTKCINLKGDYIEK